MGYAHPDYLLDQLTSAQLSEWEAYNQIEQVGEFRRDFHIAQLTSIFYNFASSFGSKSGRRVVSKPQDFMPWLDQYKVKESEEQTVGEMKEVLTTIAASVNEKEDKKGKEAKRFPYSERNKAVKDV